MKKPRCVADCEDLPPSKGHPWGQTNHAHDCPIRVAVDLSKRLADTAHIPLADDLPSSCSSSHPEIRYQGAECPLCEALRVLGEAREMVACLEEFPLNSALAKAMYATLDHIDAIRSRSSSDPGAGEVGK